MLFIKRIIKCDVKRNAGLSLIEFMLVVTVIVILAVGASLIFNSFVKTARVKKAVSEILSLQTKIKMYEVHDGSFPDSLDDIEGGNMLDPWGNPYQYTNFDNVPSGQWRKDHNLHPLNTDYDLWSMGIDGESSPPITANASLDDIIRANDGQYVGRATEY
jgi:general secretion pathway protein G